MSEIDEDEPGMERVVEMQKKPAAKRPSSHRERASEIPAPLHPMLELQQQAGNQAMQQLLRTGAIRAKLEVSQPGDPEEQEADNVADRIMRSHAGAGAVASSCGCSEDDESCGCPGSGNATVSRSASAGTARMPSTPSAHGVLNAMRSSASRPLDAHARAFFEPKFGRDFSDIRVHTDSASAGGARAIDAHAFTTGSDIFFASGKYAPGTDQGMRLLAHELTHTVQQDSGNGPARAAGKTAAVAIGQAGDAVEHEARQVSARVMHGDVSGAVSKDHAAPIRRSWYGDAWDTVSDAASGAADWVGDKAQAAGEAVHEGAKWVGNKVEEGAEWVGNKAEKGVEAVGGAAKAAGKWALGKFQSAWDCLQAVGHAGKGVVTGDITSLSDLLSIPQPEGKDPSTLDTILAVLQHPCLQMIPGFELVSGGAKILKRVGKFLSGAWEVIQNPQPLIDGLKNSIGKMISAIPGKVQALVQKALTAVGNKAKEIGEGVWRHIEPKLEYLGKNWWDVIKQTGWNLLWPWPSVGKDLGEVWDHLKLAGDHLWNLRFSKAIDEILAVERGVNSIAGALYGWFFIAAVLVGAILGGIFGVGAGAVPGAMAGAAIAGEVGEGLVVAMAVVETASIAKSAYNLFQESETKEEAEKDYEQIASSSLTLAITGVMMILGEIAVRFAKSLFSRVAGLFRAKPADVAVDAAAATGKGPKVETVPDKPPALDVDTAGGTNTKGPKVENADTPPKLDADAANAVKSQDLPQLDKKVLDPDEVHVPDDPKMAEKYDAEIEVGDHVYRRSKANRTWCKYSDPVCGINLNEINEKVDWAKVEKQATAETRAYWKGKETPSAFARTQQTFSSLAKTLKNKVKALGKAGQASILPAVDESVLGMPVDEFIRSQGSSRLRSMANDLRNHPDFIKEFVSGGKGQGTGNVGARKPDIIEFFLDRNEVVITDITLDVNSPVHQFKTEFYREVLQKMLGSNPKIDVYGLDINPVREPFPTTAIHD
jgi:hypothetical protein